MVGTSPIDLTRSGSSAVRTSADRSDDPHVTVASASARYRGSSSGFLARIASRCTSRVLQSPREIGPVSSNPFSIVRRIRGSSPSGGAPASSASDDRGSMQRDEVAAREHRGRVVQRPALVRQLEGLQPEGLRKPEAALAGPVRFRGDRAVRAVELLRAAPLTSVCSGWTEKRFVWGSSAASGRRSAHVSRSTARARLDLRPRPRRDQGRREGSARHRARAGARRAAASRAQIAVPERPVNR